MAHFACSDQGRNCPQCLNASRAAIGLAPLHQKDGGHEYRDGVVFPLEDGPQEEPEEGRPVPAVDQVESWPARVLVALLLIVVIAAALSPLAFI